MLLVVLALLNVVGAVADGLTIELLVRAGNGNVTEAERALEEIRQGVVGLTLLVVSIVTIVLFLMWFFRAYRNLPRLGAAAIPSCRRPPVTAGAPGWCRLCSGGGGRCG